jgi:hypothetical protein
MLEPQRQSVPIRAIRRTPRHRDLRAGDGFEAKFEERPIVDFEQPIGDMNSEICIDADQIGIEGRMVDLRQWQPIRDDRLT